jgi:hypothetical protein
LGTERDQGWDGGEEGGREERGKGKWGKLGPPNVWGKFTPMLIRGHFDIRADDFIQFVALNTTMDISIKFTNSFVQ